MDFVASRADERKTGWRNRIGDFLRDLGVTVFDPWEKPDAKGLYEYGREGDGTDDVRNQWTYAQNDKASEQRANCTGHFWETMHIDLRMVDTSDFVVAYCPTNIYSVGTVHEIVLCRQQRKPVLFVSPQVRFPSLHALRTHLKNDLMGSALLKQLESEIPVKENPGGIPSLWYMPLVGGERFFDGFGFRQYMDRFKWKPIPIDKHEQSYTVQNPLLPYMERLKRALPKKWDNRTKRWVRDDDWLLWDL